MVYGPGGIFSERTKVFAQKDDTMNSNILARSQWYREIPRGLDLTVYERMEVCKMTEKPTYEALKEKVKVLYNIVGERKKTEEALRKSEEKYPSTDYFKEKIINFDRMMS